MNWYEKKTVDDWHTGYMFFFRFNFTHAQKAVSRVSMKNDFSKAIFRCYISESQYDLVFDDDKDNDKKKK